MCFIFNVTTLHSVLLQFCALTSTVCLVLMWIGRSISGTTLLYIIFMSLLLAPGICIYVLPPVSQHNILDWPNTFHSLGSKGKTSAFVEDLT